MAEYAECPGYTNRETGHVSPSSSLSIIVSLRRPSDGPVKSSGPESSFAPGCGVLERPALNADNIGSGASLGLVGARGARRSCSDSEQHE